MTKSKAPTRGIPVIVYPPGVKDLTQDLSKDELIRRLKMLARAFQDMEQEEEISQYEPLALYLVEPFFVKHHSKDIRLLVACCVADIFRIFAPEAPFRTVEQLKMIFQFINKQLWGLENVEGPSWKRYFYLLENLAMVKSYNICMELDDANEIFVELFTIFFSIISENHTPKVRTFMLDVMCPLISENDAVPSDLLEIILSNLLDSKKLENPLAYQLAKDLIKRTSTTIEPSIQTFFNNILILGRISESDMSSHAYELIYQLNTISSTLLLSVLPQLEFKLKSNDEKERLQVTRLLGRMFSDKDSDLISQNKPLWNCFLGRFSDICTDIRARCVKFVSQFLIYHSYVSADLTERLRERAHDTDEGVRQEVVSAVVTAAKRDIGKITDEMLTVIKERTLDKKWKIRKEAVLGLGHIYKKWYHNTETSRADYERLKWVKNKLLHMYYQSNIDDRLLVERIFTMTLVPYTMEVKDRMKRLFQLFATVDQHAVKAIMELMKCQHLVRSHVRELMALYHKDRAKDKERLLLSKLVTISKYLPEPSKAQEHLKKLSEVLNEDLRIRGYMNHVVDPAVTCKKATQAVAEVMKKFGNPKNPSPIYETIKTLMERISPLMIDAAAVKELIGMVAEHVEGKGEEYDEEVDESPTVRGLKLLQTLSVVFPSAYKTSEARELLMTLLKNEDENVSDIALQIFIATGHGLEADNPQIASSLLPMLMSKARTGTKPQAKSAVHCIGVVAANRQAVYKMVFESCRKCLTLEHENFVTSLTSLGHIAKLAPQHFALPMKNVIASSIVKGLLMQDATDRSHIKGIWCHDDVVSNETKAKICAIKTIIHWLQGMHSNQHGSATSTLRLLTTYIKNEGDLMERNKASKAEMSRLRLAAGCAMLKLAQEPCYAELFSLEQFQLLALLINDECYQVRERFAKKLNKGLISLRLPLSYMAIFSLCAKDPVRESRTSAKQYIQRNIQARREYIKIRMVGSSQMLSLLPENVIPYAIHLLAHDPDFTTLRDIEALTDIKECLWFMLEPLVNRNENCSFIRKLVETIKRTKDAQTADDKSSHKRLYAVCDIVLGLLLTKTPTYSLKEHPGDVLLPVKLFVKPKKAINSHMDSFLPKKLQEEFSKVPGEEKKNPTDKLLETPPPKGKGAKQAAANNKKQNTSATQDASTADDKPPPSPTPAPAPAAKGAKKPTPAPAPTTTKGAKKNQKLEKSDENTPKPSPKKGTRSTTVASTSAKAETSNTSATQNNKKVPARTRRGALAEKKITNNQQDSSQSSIASQSSTPKSPVGKRKLKTSKKQSSSNQSSQDESAEESPVKRRKLSNNKQKSQRSSQASESDSQSSPVQKGSKAQQSIRKFLTRSKAAESPSSPSSTRASPAKRPQKRPTSEESPAKAAKKAKTTKAAVESKRTVQKRGEAGSVSSPRKKVTENSPAKSKITSTSESSRQSSGSQVKRKLLNGPSTHIKRLGTRSSTKSTRSGRTRMDSPLTSSSSSSSSSPAVPSPKKLPSKSENRTRSLKKGTLSMQKSSLSPRKSAPSPTKAAPSPKKVVSPSPKRVLSSSTKVISPSPKKLALSPKKLTPSPKKPAPSPKNVHSSSPPKVVSPSPKKATITPRKFASKKVRGAPPKSPQSDSPQKVVSPNRTFVQKKLTAFTRGRAGNATKMTSTPKVTSSPVKKPLLTGKKAPSPVKAAPLRMAAKRNLTRSNSPSSSSVSSPSSINLSPRKMSPRKGGPSSAISPRKKTLVNARKNVRNARKATSRQVNGVGTSDGESSQSTSDEDSQSKRSTRTRKLAKTAQRTSPKKKVAAAGGGGLNTSRKSRRRKP